MEIFFSTPPPRVRYPYVLTTMSKPAHEIINKYHYAELILLDAGVELFFLRKKLRDYPAGYLEHYADKARLLSKTFKNAWVTIPDYPDDYYPGYITDNVEKTIANIRRFITVPGVQWLPVIQSRFHDRFSFLSALAEVRSIIGDYERVAIGTVCKSRDSGWIAYTAQATRNYFPHSKIHAFGATLKALPKFHMYVYSADSVSWDWGRGWEWNGGVNLRKHGWLAKKDEIYAKLPATWAGTTRLQVARFIAFLQRVSEITGKNFAELVEW